MLAYIPAPWILWALDLAKLKKNQDFQRAIEGAFVALERFEAAGDPDAQVETWFGFPTSKTLEITF